MDKKKKLYIIIGSIAAVIAVTALILAFSLGNRSGEDSGSDSGSDSSSAEINYVLSLDKSSYSSAEDQTFALVASVSPYGSIKWTSDNTSVASVDWGTVLCKKPGTATITASCGNAKARCIVTVTSAADAPILSLVCENSFYSIKIGETAQTYFKAYNVYMDGATEEIKDAEITVSSNNTNLVTADGGVISGIRHGATSLTAVWGEQICTVKVTVYDDIIGDAAAWLKMIKERNNVGKYYLLDSDIDFADVTYSGMYTGSGSLESSDNFMATVDGNGHSLKNITLDCSKGSQYVSLFGSLKNAKISNISFENVKYSSSGSTIYNACGLAVSVSGNSTELKNIYLDCTFEKTASSSTALLGSAYAGKINGVLVTVKTPNGNTANDGVKAAFSINAACSNVFVCAEKQIGDLSVSGLTVFTNTMEAIWSINGNKALSEDEWEYRSAKLPALKK